MKKNGKSETDFFADYAEFSVPSEATPPPSSVSVRIHDQIKSELVPDVKTTLIQLLLIHMISGMMTLVFCPQFGIGPFGGGEGLVGFVEQYGHVVCGVFCGAFFVSLTTLLSWFCLKTEIQRTIQQNQITFYLFLGILSFSTLVTFSLMLGGQLPHLHMEFILPWLASFTLFPIALNWAKKKVFALKFN